MPFILADARNGLLHLTLNRPEVLNSFNAAMAGELIAALEGAATDPSIRAILLTGAGRAFCAGQDLAEVAPNEDGDLPQLGPIVRNCYNPMIGLLRSIEKPIVCAVNGTAAGAGANLALACDIVLASREASFVQSFSRIGLVPDSGGTFFLPRLIGLARAVALTMLAEKVSAEEAAAMGMIYRVCDPAELLPEAERIAGHLATQPTRGLGLTKRLFNQSLGNDLINQLSAEEYAQSEAGQSADYREGVTAFLEKRKAVFRGM